VLAASTRVRQAVVEGPGIVSSAARWQRSEGSQWYSNEVFMQAMSAIQGMMNLNKRKSTKTRNLCKKRKKRSKMKRFVGGTTVICKFSSLLSWAGAFPSLLSLLCRLVSWRRFQGFSGIWLEFGFSRMIQKVKARLFEKRWQVANADEGKMLLVCLERLNFGRFSGNFEKFRWGKVKISMFKMEISIIFTNFWLKIPGETIIPGET
jgi:hypothetical protein